MAVLSGVQLGVYVTRSMSSNSIQARGSKRLYRGCTTVHYSAHLALRMRTSELVGGLDVELGALARP